MCVLQVAAGSLVLKPVPPGTMVAGSPAREVGYVIGKDPGSARLYSAQPCLAWLSLKLVHFGPACV